VLRRGLDSNVLIYAQMPSLPDHARVRGYVLEQLQRPDVQLVITPAVLHEFIHIVTDARRFDPPVSMMEAISVARLFLGRPNVLCLATDDASAQSALTLLERHRLGRKRLADTLFAATLLRHGVRDLITCNPGDFRLFEGLSVTDPRDAAAG
jgi:predicted nucleic acid-binding protein